MSGASVTVMPAARWATAVADRLADRLAAPGGARVSVALAGGATPLPIYRLLTESPRAERVPWARLDLFLGDERLVPADDPESNGAQISAALGACGRAPGLRFHRPIADDDGEAAAARYAASLPARLDLLLLGVGADGHTASLFPGSSALAEIERRVVAVVGPKPPPRRLTITPPVIASAREILVLVRGEDKATAVAMALAGPWAPARCPAQLARRGHWFVDEAAAARLPVEVR